mmetsp:Transcript_5955/g.13540  ORF Transcript_5955/g.13540 Transcript_5955/m.13540 type:complete len:498 (-) Transcript_5955:39-1532(-)
MLVELLQVFGRVAVPCTLRCLKGNRECLIVYAAAVEGEDAHEQHHVTTIEHHLEHLVEGLADELVLVEDENGCEEGHDGTVTSITEHDTEEEGEGDNSEHSGVVLLVAGNTVSVDNRLEPSGELVVAEERGGGLLGGHNVEHSGHQGTAGLLGTAKSSLHRVNIVGGAPALGDQALVRDIVVEQVHGVVDSLVASNLVEPGVEGKSNAGQHGVAMVLGPLEHGVQVLGASVDLDGVGVLLRDILRERVLVGTERVADLGDLGLGTLTGEENNVNCLLHVLSRLRVDDRVIERVSAQNHVTPGRAEKHAAKLLEIRLRNQAGNETQTGRGSGSPGSAVILKKRRLRPFRGSRQGRASTLEKLATALQNILQFHSLGMLAQQGVIAGVELDELLFVLLQASRQIIHAQTALRGLYETVLSPDLSFANLVVQETQNTLHLIALAHVVHKSALECRLGRIEILELDGTKSTELLERLIRSIVLNEQLHQLHLLRPKLRHLC